MASEHQPPFAGANALIFGGAKGIGRCVALEWARRGARLAIADIDEAAAQETAAEVEAAGGKAVGIAANVMAEESIAAAVATAENALGGIDILMNNVGGMLNGHPEDIPIREWQRIMELNYLGSARGTMQLLPRFIARGSGHIVNTASFAGLYPYAASRVPYAASKAAVIAMSENLAVYCEPRGVRVSCLIPGPVATNVMDSMTSWTEDCPLRGPGTETTLMLPEQVAVVLADGMRDGRILIPSDDVGLEIVKRWAQSPDGFIRARIDEFASGNRGNPAIPDAIRAAMGARK
ncbi:MAG: SDR family oxidoreductase [Novosphingobium sp.]|jgi:NAD(P)-dependent dehydrogenase (short-subunit alcohol dehydrogenase family)|nr:SDR family oxidoreductase [Novosphingobium sp.]